MNNELSIKSVEDIVRCSQIAMLLEVSGYPKPGNVHRTYNFPNTRYEHFLIGAVVCGKSLHELVQRGVKIGNGELELEELNLGNYILKSIYETDRWQKGGNINLGILLLIAPISAASGILLQEGKLQLDNIRKTTSKVVKNTTIEDAVNLYKAIRMCEPGGLGEVKDFDVMDESSIDKIISEKMNLYDIFKLCASWDSIAAEWITDFKITFEIGYPYFQKILKKTNDINIAIVDTYLYILSRVPDTLIQRKFGVAESEKVSSMAGVIISEGGLLKKRNEIYEFDKELHINNNINPGTTADLTAAAIFLNLLNNLKI